jgi:hypothetical protein
MLDAMEQFVARPTPLENFENYRRTFQEHVMADNLALFLRKLLDPRVGRSPQCGSSVHKET